MSEDTTYMMKRLLPIIALLLLFIFCCCGGDMKRKQEEEAQKEIVLSAKIDAVKGKKLIDVTKGDYVYGSKRRSREVVLTFDDGTQMTIRVMPHRSDREYLELE